MRHFLIILFLTFNNVYGQNKSIEGKYVSGENFVIVSDSTVEFRTKQGCCFVIDTYGYGSFNFRNDSVYIATRIKSEEHSSSYSVLNNLTNSSQVHIKVASSGQPIQFCTITIRDKSNNKTTSYNTDSTGLLQLDDLTKNNLESSVIIISDLGYDHLEIQLDEIIGKSILINLLNYEVIRDRQVSFKYSSDISSTRLIGPFFTLTKEQVRSAKKNRQKLNFQVMTHSWPWNWRFEDSHTATPTIFVRQ